MTGVVLAREFGADVRGQYAAAIAWFGLLLIVGELGQTAATAYYVAREPDDAPAIVATARVAMSVVGTVLAVVGIFGASVLARGEADLAFAYRVLFVAAIPSFAGASYWFALQAKDISTWNLVRVSQPLAYLVIISLTAAMTTVGLRAATVLLACTTVAQSLLAFLMARRWDLSGGKAQRRHVRRLLTYGSSQMASTAPQTLNGRLDQLVMSQSLRPSAQGHYAVAVTYTSLAVPLVSAVGSVLFPRLARMERGSVHERSLVLKAVWGSLASAVLVVGVLTAVASWLIPTLFGQEYSSSVRLAWLLAPGGVFLASSQVLGDLLRGRGQPMKVAVAQAVGLGATVIGLAVLMPLYGASGAAVTASVAGAVIWVGLLRPLVSRSEGGINI